MKSLFLNWILKGLCPNCAISYYVGAVKALPILHFSFKQPSFHLTVSYWISMLVFGLKSLCSREIKLLIRHENHNQLLKYYLLLYIINWFNKLHHYIFPLLYYILLQRVDKVTPLCDSFRILWYERYYLK